VERRARVVGNCIFWGGSRGVWMVGLKFIVDVVVKKMGECVVFFCSASFGGLYTSTRPALPFLTVSTWPALLVESVGLQAHCPLQPPRKQLVVVPLTTNFSHA